MIDVSYNEQTGDCRILLQPSASLNKQQAIWFVAFMSLLCLTIAIGFMMVGLWMILPFAGLEISALIVSFHFVMKRNERYELIRIKHQQVIIDHGPFAALSQQTFQLGWLHIQQRKPKIENGLSQLMLGSHGRLVEVGGFLHEQERIELAAILRRYI